MTTLNGCDFDCTNRSSLPDCVHPLRSMAISYHGQWEGPYNLCKTARDLLRDIGQGVRPSAYSAWSTPEPPQ